MRSLKFAALSTSSALFLLDAATVLLLWPLAMWTAAHAVVFQTPLGLDARWLLPPACNLLLLYAMGMYRREALLATRDSLARLPLVVGLGAGLAVGLIMLVQAGVTSLFERIGMHDLILVFAAAGISFTVAAFIVRVLFLLLLSRRVFRHRLMVIGAGKRALDLFLMLRKEGSNLHYDLIFVHDPVLGEIEPRLQAEPACRIVSPVGFDLLALARDLAPDQIVVAPDERRGMRLQAVLDCKKNGYPVVQYLSFVERELRRIDIKRLELSWIVYSEGFYFGFVDRALKKALDVLVAVVMLLLASPFMLASAIAIKLDGPGPILYRQQRVTRGNQVFWIYKLRTMRTDAEKHGAVWAASQDNRITRVGNFLRRTRLDEVPQLWNVLRGDMSLVGPRPERPVFIADLANKIPLYNERHMVQAGLTGWAQINYPYGASIDDARSKLSYDLYYVKNFSILFDCVIILQTLRVVLFPSGAR